MKNFLVCSMLVGATFLAACGSSDDGGPPQVAVADAVLAANASSTAAVAQVPFSFPDGVPVFGTTSTTTFAFTSTATNPAFSVASGGSTATGTTSFGSCEFQVATTTFPATSPLGTGKKVFINPCTITVGTKGQAANNVPQIRTLTLQLGAVSSRAASITITISVSGVVFINGTQAGTVTVAPITGGSS